MSLPAPPARAAEQPGAVAWPTRTWPTGDAPAGVAGLVDEAFDDPALETTYAVVVVRGGQLVAERYGNALPSFTHAPSAVRPETALLGWSMAKSVTHAALGVLAGEGRFDVEAPLGCPEWPPGDPRAEISARHALRMRDGLAWSEDYVDEGVSDVIAMLFGEGKDDVAHYAATRVPSSPPGEAFNYSSGTTNLLSRRLGQVVGTGEGVRSFLTERVFAPIGAHEATVGVDAAGTFVGSSFVYATARDWARFATLYLRGGAWEGRQLLPRDWVLDAQRITAAVGPDGPLPYYSHHWWCDGEGGFLASGYHGQRVYVLPDRDAVVVRLGDTPAERYDALRAWLAELAERLR